MKQEYKKFIDSCIGRVARKIKDEFEESDGKFAPKGQGESSSGTSSGTSTENKGAATPYSESTARYEAKQQELKQIIAKSKERVTAAKIIEWGKEIGHPSFGYSKRNNERNAKAYLQEWLEKKQGEALKSPDAQSQYKAVRETPKAILLEKDGTQFWIKRVWLRADGSLTPAGENAFNEAVKKKEREKAYKEALEKDIQRLKQEGVEWRPAGWENDDVTAVDFTAILQSDYDRYGNGGGGRVKKIRVFVPKEGIRPDGRLSYEAAAKAVRMAFWKANKELGENEFLTEMQKPFSNWD